MFTLDQSQLETPCCSATPLMPAAADGHYKTGVHPGAGPGGCLRNVQALDVDGRQQGHTWADKDGYVPTWANVVGQKLHARQSGVGSGHYFPFPCHRRAHQLWPLIPSSPPTSRSPIRGRSCRSPLLLAFFVLPRGPGYGRAWMTWGMPFIWMTPE